MKTTRVTYDFFKKSSNGLIAHLERRETVEVFGCRKSDILTEDGKDVQERFALLLLVEMGMTPSDLEDYDYHTVNCVENEYPDDFLTDDEEEDENEESDEEKSEENEE